MSVGPLFLSTTQWTPSPRSTPAGKVLFAVGDVHGRLDLLLGIQRAIVELVLSASGVGPMESDSVDSDWRSGRPTELIYLGDYIDRGPACAGVLQQLSRGLNEPLVHEVFLAGNHDQFLIEALAMDEMDMDFMRNWFANGGTSTLGQLEVPWLESYRHNWGRFRDYVSAALGDERVRFLQRLEHYYLSGEYLFVHAGVDPNRTLEEQDLVDLLMIRQPFLSWTGDWPHPFCVVHGHTPERPSVCGHRIGVDSGAFYTDSLTAVQLAANQVRFLTVSTRPDNSGLALLPGSGTWEAPVPLAWSP